MPVKGVIYLCIIFMVTKKKHIQDLKISGGIGGGEALNGGAVLGGGGLYIIIVLITNSMCRYG